MSESSRKATTESGLGWSETVEEKSFSVPTGETSQVRVMRMGLDKNSRQYIATFSPVPRDENFPIHNWAEGLVSAVTHFTVRREGGVKVSQRSWHRDGYWRVGMALQLDRAEALALAMWLRENVESFQE